MIDNIRNHNPSHAHTHTHTLSHTHANTIIILLWKRKQQPVNYPLTASNLLFSYLRQNYIYIIKITRFTTQTLIFTFSRFLLTCIVSFTRVISYTILSFYLLLFVFFFHVIAGRIRVCWIWKEWKRKKLQFFYCCGKRKRGVES